MDVDKIKFRKVFITQPSHNFSALMEHAQDVVFLTSGRETFQEAKRAVRERLEEMNPDKDAIVAVGKVNTSLLIGTTLGKLFPDKDIIIGIYSEGDYDWEVMET